MSGPGAEVMQGPRVRDLVNAASKIQPTTYVPVVQPRHDTSGGRGVSQKAKPTSSTEAPSHPKDPGRPNSQSTVSQSMSNPPTLSTSTNIQDAGRATGISQPAQQQPNIDARNEGQSLKFVHRMPEQPSREQGTTAFSCPSFRASNAKCSHSA
jgi:hypothetical protein